MGCSHAFSCAACLYIRASDWRTREACVLWQIEMQGNKLASFFKIACFINLCFAQNWMEKFRHSCKMYTIELSSIFLDCDRETSIVFNVFHNWLLWKTAYWYIMLSINWENDLVPEYRIIERVFIVFLLSSLWFKKGMNETGWVMAC